MPEQDDEVQGDLVDEIATEVTATIPAPYLSHIIRNDVSIKTREVFVGEEILPAFGNWIIIVLRYLESLSHAPITVWLDTPGGDVPAMFAFHDMVRASACEITTVGVGQVCSAGVLMLACGHQRLASESCVLMSHRGDEDISGDLESLEAQLKVVRWNEEHWAVLMERYTPDEVNGKARDAKYWFALGKKQSQWWITGGDAIVAEGLADEVLARDTLRKP